MKLFVLIACTILVSAIHSQAPSPSPPPAPAENITTAMNTALDALVTGKCWRASDLSGLTFSATATSRRAQTPTPPSTCTADWATVRTKWNANNQLVADWETQFVTAMASMTTCLSARRLQTPTPPPNPTPAPEPVVCTAANAELTTAFDTLGKTLLDATKSDALATDADAVTITNTAVTVTGNNGSAMATAAWAAYNTLRNDCGENKLMSLPTSRRLQTPTPPHPTSDAECNTKLANVLGFRATRIAQVTNLITQATTANCVYPTRRLRRIMRLKYEERTLQVPTASHFCDTAEKAIRLALSCLTINGQTWTASNNNQEEDSGNDSGEDSGNDNDANKIDNGDADKNKGDGNCASYVMKIAAVGVMSLAAMFL